MAQITLNATAPQSARIQEARASYNAQTGKSFTVKEWLYLVIGQAVQNQLWDQPEAAAQAVRASIDTDMAGGT